MTTEFGRDPTPRSYIAFVRRRRWWIAAAALLGLGASLTLTLTQPDQYSSTAQILVQTPGSTAFGVAPAAVTPTDVRTDLQLITSAQVARAVSKRLGAQPSLSATEVAQTKVIAITAVSSSPPRAALVANTYANAFVSYQHVAVKNLAAVEPKLRIQIRTLGKQIKSLSRNGNTASEQTALLNQEAVL